MGKKAEGKKYWGKKAAGKKSRYSELAPLTTQKVHWQLNYWDDKKGLAAFSIIDICRGRICF